MKLEGKPGERLSWAPRKQGVPRKQNTAGGGRHLNTSPLISMRTDTHTPADTVASCI